VNKQRHNISGFSKLNKAEKIDWVHSQCLSSVKDIHNFLNSFQHPDSRIQNVLDGFSENTLSNFPLPYGVAPHFDINGINYCIPMVIEESSVVAAASSAAKFWAKRGGIKAEVHGTVKLGHVHFYWNGNPGKLSGFFESKKSKLIESCDEITSKMNERGGGILDSTLKNMWHLDKGYFQIEIKFETCDSMGANFINSVLEKVASTWQYEVHAAPQFYGEDKNMNIVMCILSNYNPECRVRAEVQCSVNELGHFPNNLTSQKFAEKFEKAVRIAQLDTFRATTHNKGIFNGIDAVVLATGNDFRAIESCGHTYASRDGNYKGLSNCSVNNGTFKFWLEIPLPVGTVGGLTKLHPLAALSLQILNNPSARDLMKILASVGLMQNFAALRSLVTTGIQKGHMKMHLSNILNQLQATEKEFAAAVDHFANKLVSFSKVREYLNILRNLG
jgi:hydroxymethylglutaryl-CoA reductase